MHDETGKINPNTVSEPRRSRSLRRLVYEIVDGGHGEDVYSRLFDWALICLILLNIAAFALETVPSINARYGNWLHAFEVFSVAIFTVEYGLRLWSAVEMPYLRRLSPWRARVYAASRPALVIDLLAILPFYLALLLPMDLRLLRMLRLFRFLKLTRYSPAMHTLVRVLYNERRSLAGAGLLLAAALLVVSTIMHHLEHDAQPDKFGSIPEAAYWAMTTLSSVGYGDVVPITPLGKAFAMLTMLVGLCVVALPVAIIATGFAQEVGRRDFVVTWSLMSRIPLLADLESSEAAELMPLLHAHNLPAKFEVIADGHEGDAMYFVASGVVMFQAPRYSRTFEPGDFFGTSVMLRGSNHAGSYHTKTRCRLLKLYHSDFRRLQAISHKVGARIIATAEARDAELNAALQKARGSGPHSASRPHNG